MLLMLQPAACNIRPIREIGGQSGGKFF